MITQNKTRLKKFLCDVLVIGNGSAGLRTAIEAHDCGANVIIVSKSKRGDPHTVLATGGINAEPLVLWIQRTTGRYTLLIPFVKASSLQIMKAS
jgi:siroheme synthase (precorrin-2 oxidase/ferrochelatase)